MITYKQLKQRQKDEIKRYLQDLADTGITVSQAAKIAQLAYKRMSDMARIARVKFKRESRAQITDDQILDAIKSTKTQLKAAKKLGTTPQTISSRLAKMRSPRNKFLNMTNAERLTWAKTQPNPMAALAWAEDNRRGVPNVRQTGLCHGVLKTVVDSLPFGSPVQHAYVLDMTYTQLASAIARAKTKGLMYNAGTRNEPWYERAM